MTMMKKLVKNLYFADNEMFSLPVKNCKTSDYAKHFVVS